MACLLMTSVVAAGHPSSDEPRCCATFTALGCSASSSGCDAHSITGIVSALKAKSLFTMSAGKLAFHRETEPACSRMPSDLRAYALAPLAGAQHKKPSRTTDTRTLNPLLGVCA